MEGPSIVIACEELKQFTKRPITIADGTAKLTFADLKNTKLLSSKSWGKHLILNFSKVSLRIHFLMFGSYRINEPRDSRDAKLRLKIGKDQIYFYSCAIKVLPQNFENDYDWSIDLMSTNWDPKKAARSVLAHPAAEVCDVLLDQTIFSGLGNIMKNEILFKLRMHPSTKIKDTTPARVQKLVKESEIYSWQFYEWKKANILKRNWKVMRKTNCPRCERKVTKKSTGKLKRMSHFCSHCQVKG